MWVSMEWTEKSMFRFARPAFNRRTVIGLLVAAIFVATAQLAIAGPDSTGDAASPNPDGPFFITPVATLHPVAWSDLTIERVTYGPYGHAGHYSDVVIKNRGTVDVGPFWMRERNSYYTQYEFVTGLGAGESTTIRLNRTVCAFGWNVIDVDSFDWIDEAYESNNVSTTFRAC